MSFLISGNEYTELDQLKMEIYDTRKTSSKGKERILKGKIINPREPNRQ
jgi:hypothetical protein